MKVHTHILDNNMRLLFIPLNNTDTVSVGVFVKVGSRYETEDENGMAHFLEHMMFKGTANMSSNDISKKLDSVGARYNAATSYESTYYYMEGHKDNATMFIDIMADIYKNPLFKKEDILIERNVVMEELNMTVDDPHEITHNLVYKTLFPNSSLKLPIIGTEKNIFKFNRADFIKFRKEKYAPNRTVFVIAGNFNLEKIKKQTIKCFKDIKPSDKDSVIPYKFPIKQTKPNLVIKEGKTITQTNVVIAFKSDNIYSPKSDKYDLISDIMASGSSSRLFELLRNKLGITYFINAHNLPHIYEGAFIIHVGVDNKRVNEVIENILQEVQHLKKYGVTDDELEKAKNIRVSALSMELQTTGDIMNFYGQQELVYKVGDVPKDIVDKTKLSNIVAGYKSVTKKEINAVIEELFSEENLNVMIFGKNPKPLTIG